jgi:LPXTG-site transpeptidase (sortase) family protein
MEPLAPRKTGKRKKVLLARSAAVFALLAGMAVLSVAGLYTYWQLRSGSDAAEFNNGLTPDQVAVITGRDPTSGVDIEGSHASLVSLYPGSLINPRYWADPRWAGPEPFGAPGIPDGFTPVSSRDPVAAGAAGAQPTRIAIPAIGLDSHVSELQLLDAGDQRAYQTPDNTVGHIPGTANPGELDNGWYFGHFDSFGLGEGNVFHRLPEVASLIRNDPVDIFIQTDVAEYMYRVTSTAQVHQDDLKIERAPNSQITLVTCWPTRIYDRRILVHAELIAVKHLI